MKSAQYGARIYDAGSLNPARDRRILVQCPMSLDLHHAHVFATDIGATVSWWCQHMRAKVFFDDELAGARSAFLAVGTGRVHVQDQNPLEADPKLS